MTAGYVDAYSLLNYHVYASFMTGNTTHAGMHIGQNELSPAAHYLLPIGFFCIGIFCATLIADSCPRWRLRPLLAIIAALLSGAIVAAHTGRQTDWVDVALLSGAMGILNTTITRAGGQSISIGYVSGDLNNLVQHVARAVSRAPLPHPTGPRDSHLRRAVILASVWVLFLFGAIAGGAAGLWLRMWALAPAIALLCVLAVVNVSAHLEG